MSLSTARDAARLHERLDQLSLLLERSQRPSQQAELTSFLSDISRKIDALDHGVVNDGLAERLDTLSRRIEDLDYRYSQPQAHPGSAKAPFRVWKSGSAILPPAWTRPPTPRPPTAMRWPASKTRSPISPR